MKFFRRRKKNGSDDQKTARQQQTPAQPRVGALRQDAPSEFVDLSTNAFERDFPKIAKRLDDQRKGHERRRTAERVATAPPPTQGEETTDT